MKKRIRDFFHHKKTLWQDPKKRIALIIAMFVLGALSYQIVQSAFGGAEATEEATLPTIELTSITDLTNENQMVKASGVVESVDQVELRSEVSARVARLHVSLGQQVFPGQLLVTFYNKDAYAGQQDAWARVQAAEAVKTQYEATLEAQETLLAELQRGARPEELAISQTGVDNAEKALDEATANKEKTEAKAQEDLDNTLSSGISSLQKSVQVSIDTLYNATNIQFASFDNSSQDAIRIRASKREAVRLLLGATDGGKYNVSSLSNLDGGIKKDLRDLEATYTVESVRAASQTTVDGIRAMIDMYNAFPLVSTLPANSVSLIATEKQRLQAELNAAVAIQNSIDTQLAVNDTALQGAETALVNAENGLASAQKQLLLTQAGASDEQIKTQEAAVKQARANLQAQLAQISSARAAVSSASAQVDKTIFRSPIAGKIATLPVRKDELVSPGNVVVSIVNNDALQIKTFIDSASLPLVSTGSTTTVNNTIPGEVTFVSPAIDPATGKVEVLVLVDNGENYPIVVGQYADVEIDAAAQVDGIQALLPLQSVYITESQTSVFVVNDQNIIEERPVVLGLIRGKDVEILQGLDGIDQIVPSVRNVEPGDEVMIQQ